MKTLIFLFASSFFFIHSFSQYKNLVMEGAGIRGIAYPGVIKVLEEKEIMRQLENVAGTSVGAIVGALASVGYTAEELREIMFSLKVQRFNDGRGMFIGGQRRLRKNFGWYRGEALEEWLGTLLEKKTGKENLTFLELHQLHEKDNKYKDLFVTATNLTQQKAETFSWTTAPEMKVKTAVRMSISIPLYFTAVFIDDSGRIVKKPTSSGNYQVYVDGGILANYPLHVFDTFPSSNDSLPGIKANKTLGIKVDRPEQIEGYKTSAILAPFQINNFRQYMSALYNIVIENLNKSQSFEEERSKTIYVNTSNISPKVRKISKTQKQQLYDNGIESATNFFKPVTR